MNDITKIKVNGEPESSYKLFPKNREFEKRAGGNGGPAGVADISLDITGATIGQIAKITAVDDTGKPTAWEAVTPETWNFVMADGTTVTKKVYVDANE